jgi:hypothetical protein
VPASLNARAAQAEAVANAGVKTKIAELYADLFRH